MSANVVVPGLTALLSVAMALAVFDQWASRRRRYQLVWAIGMGMFGVAAATEVLGELWGWSEPLYKIWYLTGAVWVAGWLGLGTVYLLAKTRFGYSVAVSLFFAGLFTLLTQVAKNYPDSGPSGAIYFVVAIGLALAVGWLTYLGSERWVWFAAVAVVGVTILSVGLGVVAPIAAPGYALDPATSMPDPRLLPGYLRLLTPFLNITGAFALCLGALYSTYIFMPKHRVLGYSLDARAQTGDEFLFNLAISPIAITVNFVASLPGTVRALLTGRLHSRVPATILIALGGLVPSFTTGLARFGDTRGFYVGQLLGAVFLFAGFLVSIDVFSEFRIPFTHRTVRDRVERQPPAATAS